MSTPRLWPGSAVLAVAFALLLLPATALADSYQIFDLGSGYHRDIFPGIDASGAVVISDISSIACGVQFEVCYETWINGVKVSTSGISPGLIYDNGTPCTPDAPSSLGPGFIAACNNGREVYGTNLFSSVGAKIFTGPDPAADFFASGILNEVRLNSSGDFVYLEGNLATGDGEIYEALDLSTAPIPEPASIFLLGTGLLTGLEGLRRRLL